MIRRPPRSTLSSSSAASDVYKRQFLAHVSECLMGRHGFYDDVYGSLEVPYEPVRWEKDVNGPVDEGDGGHHRLIKQVHVQTLINICLLYTSPSPRDRT